jgi:nucleoside-diphosphate-sugar epimerase
MNKIVFDAAVERDFDRVVYASSSMVYERATEFPVTEDQLDDIPAPDSAYGFQKLAGEYYCEPITTSTTSSTRSSDHSMRSERGSHREKKSVKPT